MVAVLKLRAAPRKTLVIAFLDDSKSTRSQGFMCFAGIVLSDARCMAFVPAWQELLEKHRLTHLHTSDFLSAKGKKDLPRDEYARRLSIVGEFSALIRESANACVLVGLESRDFYTFPSKIRNGIGAVPFSLVRVIRQCMQFSASDETFQFWFDDSETDAPKIYSAWSYLRRRRLVPAHHMAAIAFGDDRFTPQIQAADLVACGVVRHFPHNRSQWPADSAFGPLFSGGYAPGRMAVGHEYWNKDALEKNIEVFRRFSEEGWASELPA